jgi:hypothetical protein
VTRVGVPELISTILWAPWPAITSDGRVRGRPWCRWSKRRPARVSPIAPAMGVRYTDQEWKRQLNRTIQENQPAINGLLMSFGVPLLDDNDRVITEDSITK